MSTRKYHNSTNVFMLFQLIPCYLVKDDETEGEGEEGDKKEDGGIKKEMKPVQLEIEEPKKDTKL